MAWLSVHMIIIWVKRWYLAEIGVKVTMFKIKRSIKFTSCHVIIVRYLRRWYGLPQVAGLILIAGAVLIIEMRHGASRLLIPIPIDAQNTDGCTDNKWCSQHLVRAWGRRLADVASGRVAPIRLQMDL